MLVRLADRPLLIVFQSPTETFDAGIRYFEDELAFDPFEDHGPSP